MLTKRTFIVLAAVVLFSTVPVWAATTLPNTVAEVNGEKITKDQLTATLIDWQAPTVLDEMINFRIIGQEAKKAGVSITDQQIKARMDEIKKNLPPGTSFEEMLARNGLTPGHAYAVLKMQLQTEAILRKQIKITKEDLDQYRKCQHVLLMSASPAYPGAEDEPDKKTELDKKDAEVKAKIEQIAQEIKGGLSFDEAVKKYSEDPQTKDKNGDLGFFTRQQMMPEFEEAAFKLKVGEVSEPVKTGYGYHLIKLTALGSDTTGAERKDLEEKIVQTLIRQKYREWMLEVTNKAKVKNIINPKKPAPKPAAPRGTSRLVPISPSTVKPKPATTTGPAGAGTPPPPPPGSAPSDMPPPPPDSGTGAGAAPPPPPPAPAAPGP